MLNARLNAAREVAEALIPSESDIEAAIASTSRLIGAIALARSKAKLPISMGQESLDALSSTMSALIEARGAIGKAHSALASDRVAAGLKAYGMGDVSDCPPASGSLTLVDDRRDVA